MAGLRGGRRSVVVTVAAAAALVIGSWLVVSSAVATPSLARAQSAGHGPSAGDGTVAPPTTGDGAGTSTPPPEQSTGPLATLPGTDPTTPPPTTTTAGATTVPVTAPIPSAPVPAAPVAAAPATRVRGRLRHPRAGRGGAANTVTGAGSAETARVAVQLIAALNRQSPGSSFRATPDNVSLLGIWMANEGGLWADNPLNTSLDAGQYPHQYSAGGGDTGIPIFPTMAAGVAATATTLLSNPAYARIVKLLRSGSAPCLSFAKAVISSPWASSHYDNDTARFCSATPPPPTYRGRHHRR